MRHDTTSRLRAAAPLLAALLCGAAGLQCHAPRPEMPPPGAGIGRWPLAGPLVQTDEDESTVYELLEPGTGEFHVRYEVSATTPGASAYFNILRKGSGVRDWRAIDLYTGAELTSAIVDGATARASGHPAARADVEYLKIDLLRPVPEGGQARLAIEKVYEDPRGYFHEDGFDDGRIVFARVMNIHRNAVVLPAGYEIVSCNHPVRITSEADGRVRMSFTKSGQSPVFLVVRARPLTAKTEAAVELTGADGGAAACEAAAAAEARDAAGHELAEGGDDDRELLIELGDPRAHAFRTVYDATETRTGRQEVVLEPGPAGTLVEVAARVLDTGEELETRTHTAREACELELLPGGAADPEDDVVVVSFPRVEEGGSLRMRVEEERVDPARYGVEMDELAWSARCGSALAAIVLPPGWYVTGNTLPAVVSETSDGRIRLDYAAPFSDAAEVSVRARQR